MGRITRFVVVVVALHVTLSAAPPSTVHFITVPSGPGSVQIGSQTCSSACITDVAGGTTFTLVARPDDGASFGGWSGACTGMDTTCTVTINKTDQAHAHFVVSARSGTLAVSVAGPGTVTGGGGAIVCAATCSASFPQGSVVTLTAVSSQNASFSGWGGACSGTSATCKVTIISATTVTAAFKVTSFTVAASISGSAPGRIVSDPTGIDCPGTCSAAFDAGTSVTLTELPEPNSRFDGWTGGCTGTSTSCVVSAAAGVGSSFSYRKADIVGRASSTGQWFGGISTGSSFTNAPWAAWSSSITWVDVRIGDLNGDGKADIVGRNSATGEWWVALSNGSSFTTTLWATWSPSVTWTDVQIGDLNGDGKADIVGRNLATGEWLAGLSTGSSFTTTVWGGWSSSVTWADIRIGDLNGDGKVDIVGRDSATGQWWAGLSTGSSFNSSLWTTWSPSATWVDVQIGDLDGDGKADIVGRDSATGQWLAGLSTGSSFNSSTWATWSPSVTWVDVQIGDIDGDGKADIVGRDLATGSWWVGLSSGSGFSSSSWTTWSPSVSWVDVRIGDFDGDGKADIAGRDSVTGSWLV